MVLQLDIAQAKVLEEVLEATRKELRIESSRVDSHDFREDLHAREDTIESMLDQIHAAQNCRFVREPPAAAR
jgi:hypothetical protein